MADLDGVAVFTSGLCVPSKHLHAESVFSSGLLLPGGATGGSSSGVRRRRRLVEAREERERFIDRAKEEGEFIVLLLRLIAEIEDE